MSYKCNRKYLKDALLKAGKLVQQMNVLRPVFKRLHEYKPAELLLQFYTSGCNYFKHLTVQKTDRSRYDFYLQNWNCNVHTVLLTCCLLLATDFELNPHQLILNCLPLKFGSCWSML